LFLNILSLAFLLLSTNILLQIIRIPTRFLGVGILALSFVGVYSLRNSVIDCAISAVVGVIALVMKRLNLPMVPIILGMVLGRIMEIKLRQSLPRVDSLIDFINRPIAFIIFMLILLALSLHIWTMFRARFRRQ
jgi:putative tricarboxylic transport membrane protein